MNGALLGGTPVRINMAVRRAKDPTRIETRAVQKSQVVRSEAAPLPRNDLGQIDYELVSLLFNSLHLSLIHFCGMGQLTHYIGPLLFYRCEMTAEIRQQKICLWLGMAPVLVSRIFKTSSVSILM